MTFAEYVEKITGLSLNDTTRKLVEDIVENNGKINIYGERQGLFCYAIIELYDEWKRDYCK